MLDCVEAAGLRVPRHAVVSAEADLERAAEIAGFPCVLKPVDNSGSIHVRRADDLAELRAAFDGCARTTGSSSAASGTGRRSSRVHLRDRS